MSHLLDTLHLPAVAVLGFCLGGRYAILLAARDKRLFACVPYYPSIRVPMGPNQTLDAVALAADIQCPVHLVHGTGDQVFLHPVFVQVRDALETACGRDRRADPPWRGAQLHAAGPAIGTGQCVREPAVLAAGAGVPGNLPGAADGRGRQGPGLIFDRRCPDIPGTMTDTDTRPSTGSGPSGEAAPQSENPTATSAAEPKPSTALEREHAEMKDRLLRTLAEMENLRKRTEREVSDARMYGVSAFARDILNVADNMHRALQALEENPCDRRQRAQGAA